MVLSSVAQRVTFGVDTGHHSSVSTLKQECYSLAPRPFAFFFEIWTLRGAMTSLSLKMVEPVYVLPLVYVHLPDRDQTVGRA